MAVFLLVFILKRSVPHFEARRALAKAICAHIYTDTITGEAPEWLWENKCCIIVKLYYL